MKTEDLLTKQYDKDDKDNKKQFSNINKLQWYPWVGKNYPTAKQKVLIIGESQYATTEDGEYDKETDESFSGNKYVSREYVLNTVNKEEKPAKFYANLLKLFAVENEKEYIANFWSNVSFYHFFQTVDKKVSNNKHTKKEREDSWDIWYEVAKVIQPDVCIFLGIGLHQYFETWSKKDKGLSFEWKDVDSEFYEKGQQPIYGKINNGDDLSTSFWFIKHPSSIGFSPLKWNEFMKQKMPKTINFLSSK